MQKVPLVIISALDDEVRHIRSRMSVDSRIHVRPGLMTKGIYKQKPIMLVRSGVGRDAMRKTMSHLLAGHRPDLVIHVGYCGGADPKLTPGDIVIADGIVDGTSGKRHEADAELVMRGRKILQHRSIRGDVGGIVTVEREASSPHDKAFLATEHSSIGIDMESFDLAEALVEAGVPFVIARAVLDPLDYHLPSLGDAIDVDGSTDGLALVEHIIKKPSDALKLPRLQYLASQAREAIATFVNAWIEEEEL